MRQYIVSIILVASALFATAASGQQVAADPGADGSRQRLAIVVGADVGAKGTQPLGFAQKDAAKMAELFTTLGRVGTGDVWLLLAPNADGLRNALADVSRRLAEPGNRKTELFFYYSGHADEAGLQLGDTLFPMAELRGFVEKSPASVTVAILDACQSGALVRDKGGKRVPVLDLSMAPEGDARGYAIITSSSAGEKSQESEELRGSFFTHFLASGMRGDADEGKDGRVSLAELYQYTYNRTLQRTYSSGAREQHPTFDYAMTGSGQVVVSYPDEGTGRLLLPADLSGEFLVYSPDTDVVLAEVSKKAGRETVLAVPPGSIELFKRTDQALYRSRVTVAAGQQTTVEMSRMEEVSRRYLIEKGQAPVLVMAAKGGYQFFWDATIRSRSLLPSVLGGVELRVDHLLPSFVSPFVEVLVGGGVGSASGSADQPLAQSFSVLESGAGLAFKVLDSPVTIELSTEASLMVLRRSIDTPQVAGTVDDEYITVSPIASLVVGREVLDGLTLAAQFKSGYLYFREDEEGKDLGFSEVYLTAFFRL